MSNKVLLDTHVFIWLSTAKKRFNIGKRARHLIDQSHVYVSPLSFNEIAIKSMLGKMTAGSVSSEEIYAAGLLEIPFSAIHAKRIYDFQSLAHHDPFDRMLLAQAASESMTFITNDKVLLSLNLPFVVSAND